MSTIEVDTGTQIKKYIYLYEDIDTCIVSSDDIDLSQEGFILKQGKHTSNPVDIKCKLVNKEDVIRRYDDWENMHSYFSGIDCFYKEMDGFIRIEPFEVPPGRINEFKYEKYLIDRGDQFPPIESHRYYKDISYDDIRFQRDIVTKSHRDYIVDAHGITKEMNEEERKQLIVKYLINKLGKIGGSGIDELLFGCYGYRIPDKLYATDLDLVFDKILPHAYELYSPRGPYAGSNFLRELNTAITHGYQDLIDKYRYAAPDILWIEDGKAVYPSEDYAFFINLQLHLKLMNKHKNQEHPYTLMDLRFVYYTLKYSYKKYLTRHNPVYWNNKVVCDDLGDYVKNTMEELIYFRTDWLNNKSD